MEKCIKAGSNAPYWEKQAERVYARDLRNPINARELEYVRKQMEV